ncbi:MAG: RNA polymerase subunit sigma-24, partial [Gammaproteobacteria bacterium]
LLQQLGRTGEARAAYQAALAAVAPEPERRLLERRLRELPPDD